MLDQRRCNMNGISFGEQAMRRLGAFTAGMFGQKKRFAVPMIKVVEVHFGLPSGKRERNGLSAAQKPTGSWSRDRVPYHAFSHMTNAFGQCLQRVEGWRGIRGP